MASHVYVVQTFGKRGRFMQTGNKREAIKAAATHCRETGRMVDVIKFLATDDKTTLLVNLGRVHSSFPRHVR